LINCAGPFGITAGPLVRAAMTAQVPYLDISAQPQVIAHVLEEFSEEAKVAGIAVMPGAAFFGALGDLLGTAAAGELTKLDQLTIAYALDEWKPTPGSRLTLAESSGGGLAFRSGKRVIAEGLPPRGEWEFPQGIGLRATVVDYPSPDPVMIPHHLALNDLKVHMTVEAVRDILDPDVGGPIAIDALGRSAQRFLVHAEATLGGDSHATWAEGQDIYWTSAVIVVCCLDRLLTSDHIGTITPGQAFDPTVILSDLADRGLGVASRVS
jgi:hypothetical protein